MTPVRSSALDARSASASGELTLDDAVRFGVRLHQAGDLAGAERLYRSVLDLAPDLPAALHFLGLMLHQRGQDDGLGLLQRSLALSPGESGWWGDLAEALTAYGRDEEAEDAYLRGVAADPGDAALYARLEAFLLARGRIADVTRLHAEHVVASAGGRHPSEVGRAFARLGRMEEAAGEFRRWLDEKPDDPIARHFLSAARGETPEPREASAVVKAFGGYGERFDGHPFDRHIPAPNYRAPDLIGAALAEELGPAQGRLRIVDAGCGAGLCASATRPHASYLAGVDLSGRMLERARSLALYDELSQAELTAYLHAAPGSADVIVSGDAFCYFGSLAAVFQAAREALRPGGRLIFTLEADDDRHDFRLGASGRYSHGERYAREAAAAARLSVGVLRREAPRDEAGRPVAGFLVVLRRT